MAILEMHQVHAGYGNTPILHGVDMQVSAGNVTALLGRNGMGKTTTISAIAGVVPATAGSIRLDGVDITRAGMVRRGKLGIGLVPENRQVFPSCTVKEHLTLGARLASGSNIQWDLDRLYDTFPVLKSRSSARGTELSGGERQLLAIARALSSNPKLLLLDEPSEGLAPSVVSEIADVIKLIAEENHNSGIVLVEQNVKLALSVADQVCVMSGGSMVFDGSRSEFEAQPQIQDQYIGIA